MSERTFYTIKELSELYGPVTSVMQERGYVTISLQGGVSEKDCELSKRGKCASATVRPRIKIASF